jgi:DNA repair protein RecN (Recombination protein N)
VFDISRLRAPLRTYLDENGLEPCEGNQLVLKRSFTVGGTNRQFVNGSPTTLNILAALGEWLVDLHGPHDHQSLLQPSKQLAILDAYGGLETERNAFAQLVRRRSALEAEKSALIVDEKTYAQQLDLLRFQGKEIEAAKLQADEESLVEQEFNRASNSARLLQLGQTALDLLSESDNALLSQAGSIGRTLQELHRVDASARNLTQLHEQAVSTLRDLRSEISRYVEKVDVDPARLAELEERLNLIHTLKRKYGVTLAEVIAFGEDAKQKLASLETRDAELARLHAALAEIDAQISKAGKSLSVARKKVIPQLAKAAAKQLAHLGFKQSKFDVAITTAEAVSPPSPPDEGRRRGPGRGGADQNSPLSDSLPTHSSQGESDPTAGVRGLSFSSTGFDTIEFQFSPNVGEPLKPLRAIASSGEMARVMLALKTVLAAQDEIPVLVFDEVDANVGGETANAVGEKMKQLASNRQVLCITHLPQVAAPADAHYVVTKQVKDGRTISEITLLDKKSRVIELARMLGGQSDAARRHAEALLR